MADHSPIEWTDATWNPVTGCDKISPGCKHCYAERMAKRLQAMGNPNYANGFAVTLQPQMLELPLHWKTPKRIFVNSMSDLFHEDVPEEYIDRVAAVMALCPQHTFQVLTKRPERMHAHMTGDQLKTRLAERAFEYIGPSISTDSDVQRWCDANGVKREFRDHLRDVICDLGGFHFLRHTGWPLANVHLGISTEDQQRADERIPWLLRTPAAVRFLSVEPLLGPLDIARYLSAYWSCINAPCDGIGYRINWVISGGESGPGARPMRAEWVRQIRDQCEAAGVPFFFKQWGGVQKSKTGRTLDGRTYDQMPGLVTLSL